MTRVAETLILCAAWRRVAPIAVHGLIYSLEAGLLADLGCSCAGHRIDPESDPCP